MLLLLLLLMAAEEPQLTLRWVVADGYYLDEPPSVVTVETPVGIRLDPASFSTQGRVQGELVQKSLVTVARGVRDGRHSLRATADLYYCSVIEQQCWPEKRTMTWMLEVERGRAKPLEVDMHVPEK